MILYCIHDKKAETWSFPQTTSNVATAAREFELLSKRPEFPTADVELCQVGRFDVSTGSLVVEFKEILQGSDYVK